MPENQPKESGQQTAKRRFSPIKIALIIVALLLALLVVKIILLITAKPTISVNYVAELNHISKPADYDPNENAAPCYRKASTEYMESPKLFRALYPYPFGSYWLGDANESELDVFRRCLEENSLAFEYLQEATEKRYVWAEYQAKNNDMMWLKLSEPENFYKLQRALRVRAKLNAVDGKSDQALQDLLTCWKMAAHYTNPKLLLMEQFKGMSLKKDTLRTAFMILDFCNLDAENLLLWQKSWEKQFSQDKYIPSFQTERLIYYDLIQRYFINNDRGTGRLAWKKAWSSYRFWGKWYDVKKLLSCFTGPTKTEVTQIVNSVFDHYEAVTEQTPWQIRLAEQNYMAQLELIREKNPLFDSFIPALSSSHFYYYRLKTQREALITVIAVLRYKSDHGNYPADLKQLLEQKYLTKLPQDPFSDGPLIYNLLDDDFELYSVGKDFKDDYAARYPGGSPITGSPKGDELFWPPLSKGRKNIKRYKLPGDLLRWFKRPEQQVKKGKENDFKPTN